MTCERCGTNYGLLDDTICKKCQTKIDNSVALLEKEISQNSIMTAQEWADRWNTSLDEVEYLLTFLFIWEDELGGIHLMEEGKPNVRHRQMPDVCDEQTASGGRSEHPGRGDQPEGEDRAGVQRGSRTALPVGLVAEEAGSTTALVEISKAQVALERANEIHEILDLRDMAAAYALFADAKGFGEVAQQAKIFQLKAERKAGKWLDENVNHRGGNPQLSQDGRVLPEGITHNESSRWQLEAKPTDEQFNEWVGECIENDREISSSALRRLASNQITKEKLEPKTIEDVIRMWEQDVRNVDKPTPESKKPVFIWETDPIVVAGKAGEIAITRMIDALCDTQKDRAGAKRILMHLHNKIEKWIEDIDDAEVNYV